MRRKIEISKEAKAKIAKFFKVTEANVRLALTYKRNSMQSEKIRQMALDMGGRLIQFEDITPEKKVKILNSKGEVISVIADRNITL